MLAKAERIEKKLLDCADGWERCDGEIAAEAALLIQQMRLRLAGSADIDLVDDVAKVRDWMRQDPSTIQVADALDEALSAWRDAPAIEGDEWPTPEDDPVTPHAPMIRFNGETTQL